jgi:hypothetical protein
MKINVGLLIFASKNPFKIVHNSVGENFQYFIFEIKVVAATFWIVEKSISFLSELLEFDIKKILFKSKEWIDQRANYFVTLTLLFSKSVKILIYQ